MEPKITRLIRKIEEINSSIIREYEHIVIGIIPLNLENSNKIEQKLESTARDLLVFGQELKIGYKKTDSGLGYIELKKTKLK